ncbi:MAG: DUF4364 family protein [Eubacteriaceae bacterium]|nr:DUF4364 family protein [Eubacteriaceae bacterium]
MPTIEKTEEKLLILYVLNTLDSGLTRIQLGDVLIQCLQMNYFDIQHYVDQLIEEDLVKDYDMEDNGQNILSISAAGRQVLDVFIEKISPFDLEILTTYIRQNRDRILKDVEIHAYYDRISEYHYDVHLVLKENKQPLIHLTLMAPSIQVAEQVCHNWRENTDHIYASMISLLSS